MWALFCWDPYIWICILFSSSLPFLPARRSPPSSITKSRLSRVLSQDTTQRLKNILSSRSRERPTISSRSALFFCRSGRADKSHFETRRRLSLSLYYRVGPEARAPVWFSGSEEKCASWKTEGPPDVPRTPLASLSLLPFSPSFTFTLLAIIIRVLWLRGLNGTELPASV